MTVGVIFMDLSEGIMNDLLSLSLSHTQKVKREKRVP